MIKFYKKIKFMLKNSIRLFCTAIVFLIPKNKNIVALGLRTPITKINNVSKDYFMHNTKYIMLNNNSEFEFVYIVGDKTMLEKMKSRGLKNVYLRNSFLGLYNSLRAKYWLYDDGKYCINNPILSGGAFCINLWHGIPLKKIGFDDRQFPYKEGTLQAKIYDSMRIKDHAYVVNSEYEQSCYSTAWRTTNNNIKILGSPRLDILLHDIPNSDLFMEEDFKKIKNFREQGKKVFIYTPTWRDTGKDISGWLRSAKLKEFLCSNNAILVCKLHFADKNSLNFELPEEFYKMNSDSDIYPVLKYSDALITDYSSIYFDYLLLDKPILYYPVDLKEYQEKCRGFYGSYEDLTAGIKAYSEEELISAMRDVINGVDNYKDERTTLRDKMFKFQDGYNCKRVIEWIKSLDK